jgi:hypothetical protein
MHLGIIRWQQNHCRRHTISWPKQYKRTLTMLAHYYFGRVLEDEKNRRKHQ